MCIYKHKHAKYMLKLHLLSLKSICFPSTALEMCSLVYTSYITFTSSTYYRNFLCAPKRTCGVISFNHFGRETMQYSLVQTQNERLVKYLEHIPVCVNTFRSYIKSRNYLQKRIHVSVKIRSSVNHEE